MNPSGNLPTRFIIVFVIIVIILSGIAFANLMKNSGCPAEQQSSTGQCLPAGQCFAKDDLIVACNPDSQDAN